MVFMLFSGCGDQTCENQSDIFIKTSAFSWFFPSAGEHNDLCMIYLFELWIYVFHVIYRIWGSDMLTSIMIYSLQTSTFPWLFIHADEHHDFYIYMCLTRVHMSSKIPTWSWHFGNRCAIGFWCVGWDLGLWGGQLCRWRGVSSCVWGRLGLVWVPFFFESVSLDGRAGW